VSQSLATVAAVAAAAAATGWLCRGRRCRWRGLAWLAFGASATALVWLRGPEIGFCIWLGVVMACGGTTVLLRPHRDAGVRRTILACAGLSGLSLVLALGI